MAEPVVENSQVWKRVDTLLHEALFHDLTRSTLGVDWWLSVTGTTTAGKRGVNINGRDLLSEAPFVRFPSWPIYACLMVRCRRFRSMTPKSPHRIPFNTFGLCWCAFPSPFYFCTLIWLLINYRRTSTYHRPITHHRNIPVLINLIYLEYIVFFSQFVD